MVKKSNSLKSLERLLGYKFKSQKKLLLALTHSSHKNEYLHGDQKGTSLDLKDNERLEFFGDAILTYVISKKLFLLYPNKDEGELSKFRSLLVSRKSLFTLAKKIKIHHYLRLGKSEIKINLQDKTKMLADSFEAIIAAIFLDQGMKPAETFILKHFKPYLDLKKLTRLNSSENYKSILQEYTQKDFHTLPRYQTTGKDEIFTATIYFKNQPLGSAKGKSKREAEKKAAKASLQYYKKHIRKKK